MTAYFDIFGEKVDSIRRKVRDIGTDAAYAAYAAKLDEQLDKAEETILYDVTICVESPGCPEDIRDAAHRVLLRYSIQATPPGIEPPDYADLDGHAELLGRMGSDLHTVFHALGSRRLDNFTDDPRTPIRCLFGKGDERREGMLPPPVRYWRAQLQDFTAEEKAPTIATLGDRAHAYALRETGDAEKAEQARREMVAALMAEDGPEESKGT